MKKYYEMPEFAQHMAHHANGDFDSALHALDQCLKESVGNQDRELAFLYLRMAEVAFDGGDFERSKEYCNHALRVNRTCYGELSYLHLIYKKPKDFQLVLNGCEKLIKKLLEMTNSNEDDNNTTSHLSREQLLEMAFALQTSCLVALNRWADAEESLGEYVRVGEWGAMELIIPLLQELLTKKKLVEMVRHCLLNIVDRHQEIVRNSERLKGADRYDEAFSSYLQRLLARCN